MSSPFSKMILAPAILAAAALASSTAMADTVLNVPFSFTASGKACPAGMYRVEKSSLGNTVTLRSQDNHAVTFMWTVGPGSPEPTDSRIVLTFDRIGDAHTLQSVQYGNKITSRLDRKPKHPEYTPTRIMAGQ